MAKIVLNDLTNTYNPIAINENFSRIEAEFQNKVAYRDNPVGEPNNLEDDLDVDGQRIINLPIPVSQTEPVRLKELQDAMLGVSIASLVPFTPVGGVSATNVQAAIAEVDAEKVRLDSLAAAGGAALVGNTPAGGIAATTVQAAINELDTEKVRLDALAASSGSSLVGHIATGVGAVATTVQQVLREENVGLRRMNAALIADIQSGAATISAVAGLVAADALAPSVLPAGTYLIDADMTFTRRVTLHAGAKFTVSSGKTLTFGARFDAPDDQIFYGAGSVANLKKCKVNWFAGDKLGTSTDARADIQKAYDSAANRGTMKWSEGFLSGVMSSAISVSRGQKTKGAGGFSSELRFLTAACNGFALTGEANPEVDGISFVLADGTMLATSGTLIDSSAAYTRVRNIFGRSGWVGMSFHDGAVGSKATEFDLLDCMQIGFHAQNINDVFVDQFIISATLDWFDVSGVTGTFVVGEVFTGGTSGATGTLREKLTATRWKVGVDSTNFTPGETITGGTSGATATLTTQTIPHALGGIRLQNKAEAIIMSNGDVIGGAYPMTTDAASYTPFNRPAYCRFSNVFFDSADNAALYDKAVEFDFTACWWSNRPSGGASLGQIENFRFNGGGAINCAHDGMTISASAVGVHFTGGFAATGNGTAAANTYAGLAFAPNCSDFTVQGCRLGGTLGFGTQAYGALINAGTSDRYIVADNLVSGNGTAGVSDGGTGANKRVANNY
jgi:hypothetical protein